MKKVSSNLLNFLAVFSVFLLTSCSGDDDNTDPFIGNWKSIGYYKDDVYFEDSECDYSEFAINDDHTGTLYAYNCDIEDDSVNFTWQKLEDNRYEIFPDQYVTITTIFDGNTMTVTYLGSGISEVYQRQ